MGTIDFRVQTFNLALYLLSSFFYFDSLLNVLNVVHNLLLNKFTGIFFGQDKLLLARYL